ncbi:MAG: biopolymer transporter ExbD [Verrucomicrobiales bacterium]|nr:biopolymer transporter ExbD [Verrucomicrobiae bacterium]
MATKNLRRAVVSEEGVNVNMSPMIDLVFLLLIFFMVASTLIDKMIDPEVTPPVAKDALVRESLSKGRVLINILEDGTLRNEQKLAISEEEITKLVKAVDAENKRLGVETQVLIRADKDSPVEFTKKVVSAAGAGGVMNFIFSARRVEVPDKPQ